MSYYLCSIIILLFLSSAMAQDKICPDVVVHSKESLDLSDTEERMVCGDPKLEAYKNIPSYQASFFLTSFLQTRGYLRPKYELKGNTLHVHLGPKVNLEDISVVTEKRKEGERVEDEGEQLFEEKVLTPSLLNDLEARSISLLRQRGYPCAKIETIADASDGSVTLSLNKLELHNFGEVSKESIPGLRENALDRFYPFDSKDLFNERLLTLTEKRMVRAEVVQGTYFLDNCANDGEDFSLSQHFILGPPRTIRFGVGASTEVGPMVRVRWSHNRYKSMASLLSANLQASFRSQSLNLTADSYFWKNSPRKSLLSQLEILRESQFEYEQLLLRLQSHLKWTRDTWGRHWTWSTGPSYETGTYKAEENPDTKTFSTMVLEGELRWVSHDYEFFDIHPEEGDSFFLNIDFRHPSFGFSDPLLKLESSFVKLAEITDWGRGHLIGGLRVNAGTTWVSEDVSLNSLPPAVKFFGGGSDDIRGFLLRTLPENNGLGALTKFSTKLELRKTHLYLETWEAFSFLDSGYFGYESWSTLPRLWYSPGLGVRWLSPIGLVQTYVARGFKTQPYEDSGNFYYIGLGGVF